MERLDRVRQKLKKLDLDALLVTDLKNVRYLSGFTGSAGAVLVTEDAAYFLTDFRYTTQAGEQVKDLEVRIYRQGLYPEVQGILSGQNIKKLGIESDQMTVTQYHAAQETLSSLIKPTQGLVEELRQVKDADELAIIKAACEITDQAFDHILGFIKPGLSEIQIANELEAFLKGKGASAMSFDTIIASGVRSAMPHGVASDKLIELGDIITLDFGCYYKGYSSDMTRTIAVGSISDKLAEIYQIVLDAHLRVIDQTKAGMTGKEVDALARDYITQKGYGEYFGHSTGHGLGLDVHEQPAVSHRSDAVMVENMVITDEPGIYLPGIGGVRIEDDLIIQKDRVESTNRSPKELIII